MNYFRWNELVWRTLEGISCLGKSLFFIVFIDSRNWVPEEQSIFTLEPMKEIGKPDPGFQTVGIGSHFFKKETKYFRITNYPKTFEKLQL